MSTQSLNAEELVRHIRAVADLMSCANESTLDKGSMNTAAWLIRDMTGDLDTVLLQEAQEARGVSS